MPLKIVFSSLILIVTVENFSSKDLSVSLENSTSYLRPGRAPLPANSLDRQLWNFFEHAKNKRFIAPPKVFNFFVGKADSGTIGASAVPHMICDLDGHGIQRSQLRNSMVVKIRTMHRHWPGYEYLYASKDGWIYYDILRNRNDHKKVDNHKQEWIVEKNDDDQVRFENNYRTGEYLTGDLIYEGSNIRCKWPSNYGDKEVCYYDNFFWLYVGSQNPTWWKIIPAYKE